MIPICDRKIEPQARVPEEKAGHLQKEHESMASANHGYVEEGSARRGYEIQMQSIVNC